VRDGAPLRAVELHQSCNRAVVRDETPLRAVGDSSAV